MKASKLTWPQLTWLLRIALCVLSANLISGCTGLGANQNHYQSLPAKEPRITFVRNQNAGGSTVITTVAINDWVIGTLAPGEHLSISHPPGLHYVTVKGKTVPLTFRNNREYYFLIDQNRDGSTRAIRAIYAKDVARYIQSDVFQTAR